jgi:ElaB/YqjD/DUF883 family membrane-anchored ribosome-binding protein
VEEAKTRVLDAVEEAKRAIVRGTRQFEDLRNEATYRVRKAPLASVGIGFGAGIVLELLLNAPTDTHRRE